MSEELFKPDEAFLSQDWSTHGMTALWIRPFKNEIIQVEVKFQKFHDFCLTEDCLIEPEYTGQAFQPLEIYFKSFEYLIKRMKKEIGNKGMKLVRATTMDGQQHGSTYWNDLAPKIIKNLRVGLPLSQQLANALASPYARTWITSSSDYQRKRMTKQTGGIEKCVETTGAQLFERYTGPVIADVNVRQPLVIERTKGIRLIEQIPYMLMTGNFFAPIGYGGACGTALWNYKLKGWDHNLLRIALNEKDKGKLPILLSMLPAIVKPGTSEPVSIFFSESSGVPKECIVYEPTGDNPGARLIIRQRLEKKKNKPSTLISFGASITINVGLSEEMIDPTGTMALMYDYIGRPFWLTCKTNGTARWDEIKKKYNVDHREQDAILGKYIESIILSNGAKSRAEIFFNYVKNETLPETKIFVKRIGYDANKDKDVRAVIESSLADLVVHAGKLLPPGPVYVAGGGSRSEEILKILAAMLNRKIIVAKKSDRGAAMGSNYAAQFFYLRDKGMGVSLDEIIGTAEKGRIIPPNPELVKYYHRPGGYLEQFIQKQEELFAKSN